MAAFREPRLSKAEVIEVEGVGGWQGVDVGELRMRSQGGSFMAVKADGMYSSRTTVNFLYECRDSYRV